MYSKGGDTDDTYEPEVINPLDNLPEWKALENIDYTAVPDPEFTKEKTGQGDIEWFDETHPDGVTYRNGYHRDHPIPGTNVVLYNPNTNNEQDIKLDALHGMYKDPTYDTLNQLYREAAKDGDVMYNAKKAYEEDLKESNPEDLDPFDQYFNNEADGLLRNMFIEGTPEYIESKRYHPYKQELRQWNAHLMPYIDNIQNYLETGERPTWINVDDYQQSRLLPEITITNQNAYGGNLFKMGGGKKKSNVVPWSYIESELRKRGVTNPVHLSALRANMEVESGRNPGAVNPYSGAKGLLQWLGARKPKSWSLDDQLDYIAKTYNKFGGNEWLSKSAWKRFNETNDPAEAARLFRRYWERPEASSWYDTDKYFGKSRKGSFLPDDTNDVLWQTQNLQYREPRRVIFTNEDQKLLDTPMQTLFTPKYEDEQTS